MNIHRHLGIQLQPEWQNEIGSFFADDATLIAGSIQNDHEGLDVSKVYNKAQKDAFKRVKELLKWNKLTISDFYTSEDFQTCATKSYEGIQGLGRRRMRELVRKYCSDFPCFITKATSDKIHLMTG